MVGNLPDVIIVIDFSIQFSENIEGPFSFIEFDITAFKASITNVDS